jgi:hypothetical protein
MGGRWQRGVVAVAVLSLVFALAPRIAHADARTDYLVRLLRTSDAFRVRAQAALSLGSVSAEPSVIEALSLALRDESGAVRAAASSALERLGDPSALPALRAAQSDREAGVRAAASSAVRALERVARSGGGGTSTATRPGAAGPGGGQARFYVGVGMPGSRVPSIDDAILRSARSFIASRVGQMDGVLVAPESETPRQAQSVLRDRSLTGYYLDSSVVSVAPRGEGLRIEVSVVVQSYPDRNVRAMLSGAATVMGETGAAAQRTALEGALNSALSRLGSAFVAGPR